LVGDCGVWEAEADASTRGWLLAGLPLALLCITRPDGPLFTGLLAWLAGGWCLYVAAIGGDIFPGWRHLVPVVVLLAFMIAEGMASLRGRAVAVGAALCVIATALQLGVQAHAGENRRAIAERWEWDGQVVGTVLKRAFGEAKPVIAVEAGGCLPYFSGLPSIDMLGLNDPWLPFHPPENIGHGMLAHELGNGDYILRRKPDIVIFSGPEGGTRPSFGSAWEMNDDPLFHFHYTLSTVVGEEPHEYASRIWFRKDSARIGIRRTDARVEIPGWFLNSEPGTEMRLGPDDRLGAVVLPDRPVRLVGLRVPRGEWEARIEPPAPVSVEVSAAGVAGSSRVLDLIIRSEGGRRSWVGSVILERFPLPGQPG
jgi:hypothetical protein